MKKKAFALIVLAVLLSLFVTPVYADVPSLPHAFYGTVTINGDPAPVGTKVEARGEGVQTDIGNNPIVTTVEGEYGSPGPLEPKLIVQGNIAEGAVLSFYVDGVQTDQTAEWHSGEVTELSVAATISGPVPTTESTPQPTAEPTSQPAPQPAPEPTPPPTTEASPAPAPVVAPSTPPAPPTSPVPSSATGTINWPMLLAILGGVTMVGIIILIVVSRKSY
jgi:hypothetical protein